MKNLVQSYFDGAANIYDEITHGVNAWNMPELVENIISDLNLKIVKALIFGVGTGQEIYILKNKGVEYITAIDISEKMLNIARAKYDDIELIHCDVLNARDKVIEKFDLILCVGVAEFIEDKNKLIHECLHYLSDSGHLIFTYEPIITGHPVQSSKSQLIHSREQNPDYNCDGVYLYRNDVQEIINCYSLSNAECIFHKLSLAYHESYDIFYGVVGLRKNNYEG